jgi:hypothetical protein
MIAPVDGCPLRCARVDGDGAMKRATRMHAGTLVLVVAALLASAAAATAIRDGGMVPIGARRP